jgi:hypothetical protein
MRQLYGTYNKKELAETIYAFIKLYGLLEGEDIFKFFKLADCKGEDIQQSIEELQKSNRIVTIKIENEMIGSYHIYAIPDLRYVIRL